MQLKYLFIPLLWMITGMASSLQAQEGLVYNKRTHHTTLYAGTYTITTDSDESGHCTMTQSGPIIVNIQGGGLSIRPGETKTWAGRISVDSMAPEIANAALYSAIPASISLTCEIKFSRPQSVYADPPGLVVNSTFSCGNEIGPNGYCTHGGASGIHEWVTVTKSDGADFTIYISDSARCGQSECPDTMQCMMVSNGTFHCVPLGSVLCGTGTCPPDMECLNDHCVARGSTPCGTGETCTPEQECLRFGNNTLHCVPRGSVVCGPSSYCVPGETCLRLGNNNLICAPEGSTACGPSSYCPPGQTCLRLSNGNLICAPPGSTPCGVSSYCLPGQTCVNGTNGLPNCVPAGQ